jgi:P4 family phage/plasmid primase-like protien
MKSTDLKAATANLAAQELYPGIATLDAFWEREAEISACPKLEILDLHDEFWALTIGPAGNPEAPTVFVPAENQFRRYSEETGIYSPISESAVTNEILMNLDFCAAYFPHRLNALSFLQIKNRARIKSEVDRAKDLLAVEPEHFQPKPYTLALNNGILRTDTLAFKDFTPSIPLIETLPLKYDAQAKCDLFLHSFLERVLAPDDVELLQRYCSQILDGQNHSQTILVLTGDSGWGKSTLMKILGHLIGWKHVGIVRNQIFTNEFELSHYANKKLLYCPDMPTHLLDRPEASLFKQLVGGDPLWADVKNADMLTLEGNFPVILASNGKPRIHLDVDTDAWLRRLVVLSFKKAENDLHVGKLADLILARESSGILNWLLEGKAKLFKDKLQLKLNDQQKERSATLLMASESPLAFVRACIQKEKGSAVVVGDLYETYQAWCRSRALPPFCAIDFMAAAKNEIEVVYGMRPRHDLVGENGKARRGWAGLALKVEKAEK